MCAESLRIFCGCIHLAERYSFNKYLCHCRIVLFFLFVLFHCFLCVRGLLGSHVLCDLLVLPVQHRHIPLLRLLLLLVLCYVFYLCSSVSSSSS